MPGVPFEMRDMFLHAIRPQLGGIATTAVERIRRIHFTGIGESRIGDSIREWMGEKANPEIGITVHDQQGQGNAAPFLLERVDRLEQLLHQPGADLAVVNQRVCAVTRDHLRITTDQVCVQL